MSPPTNSSIPPLGPSQERPCKICGTPASVCGWVDFNRHCTMTGESLLQPSNLPVPYNLCPSCGFVFSGAFDEWRHEDFQHYIYNDEYALIDPDNKMRRPQTHVTWFEALFGKARSINMMDYGGGDGTTAQLAREAGFENFSVYDPFVTKFSEMPSGTYDVVGCFEVIEHSPVPLKTIEELTTLAGDTGIILFSTLLLPENIRAIGLTWWYVAPRNGHISLFSEESLQSAFNQFSFTVAFFDHNRFIAFKTIPSFAQHLFGKIADLVGLQ